MLSQSLLKNYIKLTEFLGRVLGPDYEVALYDLSDPNQSLMAIANNHVSGRVLGSPLTDLSLKLINDNTHENAEYRLNYRGMSAKGKILRCSTMFIKDDDESLIGLLCINFDNSRYQELSENLLKLCHPDAFIETNFLFDQERILATANDTDVEHFARAKKLSPAYAVKKILEEGGLDPHNLSQKEKMDIIAELDSRGIFAIKGAVKEVAEMLNSSVASIYRYISKVQMM